MNQKASRDYERSARVGELMREILAVEIDRSDDPRLFAAVVTGVQVDNELEKAVVFIDTDDGPGVLEALEARYGALRKAVSSQARLRRTPRLEFKVDGSVQTGNRIEEILSGLSIPPAEPEPEQANPEQANPEQA